MPGTLDPLATGVLIVCIGRATKRVDELQAEEKEYLTTVRLGATTPSYDLEHPVDQTYPYGHVTESRSWPRYRRWKENSCRSRPSILRR